MKLLPLCIFLIFSSHIMGQSLSATFSTYATMDNVWNLQLWKNKTFTYTHWSGFGGSSTLDSGNYVIDGKILTLYSTRENPPRKYLHNSYYIETVKLKKNQRFENIRLSKDKRFSIFGDKYLVLTQQPFNHSKIVSNKPENEIGVDTIPMNIDPTEFIKTNRFLQYSIYPEDIVNWDKWWTTVYNSNQLTVVIVDNKDEIYYTGFIAGNQIYDINLDLYMGVQNTILDRLQKEKIISKKEKQEIEELLMIELEKRNQWLDQGRLPRLSP